MKNTKDSMKNGYYGKIKNSSTMYVEAPYAQDGGKSPSKRTGGDLRTKGSNK